MQVLLVVLAPVLMVVFAMTMDGIEQRLTRKTDHVSDPQQFIETHTPTDILNETPSAQVT